MSELRGALAVHVELQRRVVEHLRDAHVADAGDLAGSRRASARAIAKPAPGRLLSICTSIGADRPKFSTWLTMSAGWK